MLWGVHGEQNDKFGPSERRIEKKTGQRGDKLQQLGAKTVDHERCQTPRARRSSIEAQTNEELPLQELHDGRTLDRGLSTLGGITMNHTCDCGKQIAMPQSHGFGKHTVGICCPCGVFWSIVKDESALWGRAVRWKCEKCGGSNGICQRTNFCKGEN